MGLRSKLGGIVIVKVKYISKVKAEKDNPSVSLRSTAPFTQGSLFYTIKFTKQITVATHLWVASKGCMAGRPIKSALVRSRYRVGLRPKMKYHRRSRWIFIMHKILY